MNSESKEVEFLVFIGGRAGRKARKAEPMKRRFKEEELLKLLECTIDYYNELADEKERLAEIIEKLEKKNLKNIIKRFNA